LHSVDLDHLQEEKESKLWDFGTWWVFPTFKDGLSICKYM
jgi:hypothetical protein